jgi:hypothetical protein
MRAIMLRTLSLTIEGGMPSCQFIEGSAVPLLVAVNDHCQSAMDIPYARRPSIAASRCATVGGMGMLLRWPMRDEMAFLSRAALTDSPGIG